VDVQIEGSEKAFVDKEKEYTAAEFAKDIRNLNGFTMECLTDGQTEGDFPIQLIMEDELKKLVDFCSVIFGSEPGSDIPEENSSEETTA
jgi:hypothetical protein